MSNVTSEPHKRGISVDGEPSPSDPLTKNTHPLVAVLNVVAVFILSQVVAGILVGLAAIAIGIQPDNISSWLEKSAAAQFGFIFLAEGLAISSVFYLAGRSRIGLAAIGISRPHRSVIKKALAGFFSFYVLLIAANILLRIFVPQVDTDQIQDIGFEDVNTNGEILFTLISLVVLPPLGEEILVRGYLYSKLRARFNFMVTLLVTSVLFGLAHLQLDSGKPPLWTAATDTFILALVLGYLREKTGNIWAGVIVHSLNNLVAFLIRFHGVIF